MIKKVFLLAVLGLAVGLTIPSSRTAIFEQLAPLTDDVRARMATRRLNGMSSQLDARMRTQGRLPGGGGGFESWLRSSFNGSPQDPWGNIYYLAPDRRGFVVGSNGPDGQQGTMDDITVRRAFGG